MPHHATAAPDHLTRHRRPRPDRPLSYAEKLIYTHLHPEQELREFERGHDYLLLQPDRVTMQDALAQMAMLQFMLTGRDRVAVPASLHCDHLLQAKDGAAADLIAGRALHGEVFDFLAQVAYKYGIDFWGPGGGIIHQVMLERYVRPGALIVGTDSHTPNAGGLAALAIGVGGADVVDVLAGAPWEVRMPLLTGVRLTGQLNGWASPKDVILKVAGLLGADGGTDHIIEYFGPGAATLSCTGKATICNMGAEVGATTSLFGYDASHSRYLRATGRGEVANICEAAGAGLRGDEAVYRHPVRYFDRFLEIDLSQLEPHVNGPYTPDAARPISRLGKEVLAYDYPAKLDVGLIGSCTNSSYEDLSRAATVARAADAQGLKFRSRFTVTPGSEQIWETAERDGLLDVFRRLGATVLASACGPCIGQWARHNDHPAVPNSIMTSFNRNFARRNDGNPVTHAFVAGPEVVTAMALSGSLLFNPLIDFLRNEAGELVRLPAPTGHELPPRGFVARATGLQTPAEEGTAATVDVDSTSERIQRLARFEPIAASGYENMRLLYKTKGKSTSGGISPAGKWLRFRGHLPNISQNTMLGVTNAFTGEVGHALHVDSGEWGSVHDVALRYRAAGVGQLIVGDYNYGEGSSREHAAMQPRWLGVTVVVARSFARIHEGNLKKQGLLSLTFKDPTDYKLFRQDDLIDLIGLDTLAPGSKVSLHLRHVDGSRDEVPCLHTYSARQLTWLRAGAAVNLY